MTTLELAKLALLTFEDKKAVDVQILEVKDVSVLADYFIIASAPNLTLVRALSDSVDEAFSKNGCEPKKVERDTSNNWILMDYGDIIIHIFYEQARKFYNLELMWGDAPRFSAKEFIEKN